ncbi:MAG: peptidoglycan-binding domain-containing protein [Balneola sp.]
MYAKSLKSFFLTIIILFIGFGSLLAQVWVDGYYRKDGTYVSGHYRSKPDGIPYNNYSYPGNYNPNTGKITGGSVETYLRNYYGYDKSITYDIDLSDYTNYEVKDYETPNWYRRYINNSSPYSGEEVSIVQQSLKIIGYDPGPIDGIWGPKTKSALQDLQNDYGLYDSGFITDQTLDAILIELKAITEFNSEKLTQKNEYRWFSGQWSGTGYEINYDASWHMQVSFTENGYFVTYSSPKCSAKWVLEDIVDEKITFRENLTSGFTECANNGKVVLNKVSNDKIRFKFYYQYSDELAAHAFLTKD